MESQAEFITDTQTPFLGLLGSYRAGKTFCACLKAIQLASLNIGYRGMITEPTQSMIDGVLIPTMEEVLTKLGFVEGLTYDLYRTAVNPRFILHFPQGKVEIVLRASENYERIRGLSIAWFVCDEFDTSGYEVCTAAWQKIVARMTNGNVMQGCITSTKEGFQWCYNFFIENAGTDRRVIDINVRDNPFVDANYIATLKEQLSPKQFEAYINNEFVNFAEGSVYYCYDRVKNRSNETLKLNPSAPIQIGIDFNVGKMAAVVAMVKNQQVHVVEEIFGEHNTMTLCDHIKKKYSGRAIQLFVDSAGNAQKTNASLTDTGLLKYHFGDSNVFAYRKHLLVADRIGVVNSKFLAADGKTRTLFINDKYCPKLTKCLEAQGYDETGKPDKSQDLDHLPDALGYYISHIFPPARRLPTARVIS